jgi:NADPH-dependent FMN reductase
MPVMAVAKQLSPIEPAGRMEVMRRHDDHPENGHMGLPAAGVVIFLSAHGRDVRSMRPNLSRVCRGAERSRMRQDTGDWTQLEVRQTMTTATTRTTPSSEDVTSPPTPVRVLGIAGSLRAGSYNRALLRAAQEEAPQGMEVQLYDLAPIPFYNADVEARGDPEPVALLGATAGCGSTFQAQAQVREALVYARFLYVGAAGALTVARRRRVRRRPAARSAD